MVGHKGTKSADLHAIKKNNTLSSNKLRTVEREEHFVVHMSVGRSVDHANVGRSISYCPFA